MKLVFTQTLATHKSEGKAAAPAEGVRLPEPPPRYAHTTWYLRDLWVSGERADPVNTWYLSEATWELHTL